MSGRVVSDIQTRAEGEMLYSTCDTNGCKRSHSSQILEIGIILCEKIERKVYVNQQNFVFDIQLLLKLLSFLVEFLQRNIHEYYKEIHKLESNATVCISDKDGMRIFYITYETNVCTCFR